METDSGPMQGAYSSALVEILLGVGRNRNGETLGVGRKVQAHIGSKIFSTNAEVVARHSNLDLVNSRVK